MKLYQQGVVDTTPYAVYGALQPTWPIEPVFSFNVSGQRKDVSWTLWVKLVEAHSIIVCESCLDIMSESMKVSVKYAVVHTSSLRSATWHAVFKTQPSASCWPLGA